MKKNNTEKIVFPEPNDVLKAKPSFGKYLKYLLFFGPGAILVSMTIGQGQLIIGPTIGAWAGFSLLWLITLNIASYNAAYVGSRFTMLSGISIMDVFAIKSKKGWINWVFIFIIMVFIPLFVATIINTMGQTINWVAGRGHPLAWGLLFCLLAAFLVLLGRYKALEFSQAIFVAFLGAGAVISVVMIKPDFFEMLPNFFMIGNVPTYPAWVDNVEGFTKTAIPLSMLGFLGTMTISIIPLVGYLGWVKVKRWGIFKDKKDPDAFSDEMFLRFKKSEGIEYLPDDEKEIKKSRLLLKPLLIDLSIAFVLVTIISTAYMVAGKELLGAEQIIPTDLNLVKEQARIFTSIGGWLEPMYKISVFFALFGTVYAGFEAVTRMLFESSKHISKKINNIDYWKFMIYVLIYILATGVPVAVLIFYEVSIMLILSITLLFIGVVGVIVYGFASVYMTQRILPKRYRLSSVPLLISILTIVLFMIPFLFLII